MYLTRRFRTTTLRLLRMWSGKCNVTHIRRRRARALIFRNMLRLSRDPILLQPITTLFLLYRGQQFQAYDAHVLRQYIMTTGDLYDPVSRCRYTTHELMRLDRTVGQKNTVLVHLLPNLREHRQQLYTMHALCDALEREIYDHIDRALHISSALVFADHIMPMLIQCFENLYMVDMNQCNLTISIIIKRFRSLNINTENLNNLIHLFQLLQTNYEHRSHRTSLQHNSAF